MKKAYVGIAVAAICLSSSPAFALFTNGGFETGDFSGWTLSGSGAPLSAVISADSPLQAGQTLDVDPYTGTYMARINDIYGGYHSTTLSQSDAITQADIDNGAMLYVNWGAMLIEPSGHPPGAQPYFQIDVTVGGDTTSFQANALAHGSDPSWVLAGYNGGDLWYKNDTWTFDLTNYAVGDTVDISLFVQDCAWGGHGGFAFLDGIGTVDPGNDVPEPATMLLMGTGLAGLIGARRKKKA